jgi:hypothetical protein
LLVPFDNCMKLMKVLRLDSFKRQFLQLIPYEGDRAQDKALLHLCMTLKPMLLRTGDMVFDQEGHGVLHSNLALPWLLMPCEHGAYQEYPSSVGGSN